MRNSLLSIGEAAKLKNVSIKALRYYEKLGIFNPAYIDPQSGYRYYSPAQLFDLDVILTCGELGIPLKHILDYQTEQGTIDLRQLLIEGSELAEQKIKRAHQSLLQINTYLEVLLASILPHVLDLSLLLLDAQLVSVTFGVSPTSPVNMVAAHLYCCI